MTYNRKNYSGPHELDDGIRKGLSPHCLKRLEDMPTAAYLLNEHVPGTLHCAKRGKLLVMAAGNVSLRVIISSQFLFWINLTHLTFQHAVTFHFGLEAHIIGMPRTVYNEIVASEIPSLRAEHVRSFVIPSRFTEPNSSPVNPRTINILAAFVSPSWAWTFVDFSRLGRFHVQSRDAVYEASEFDCSSYVSFKKTNITHDRHPYLLLLKFRDSRHSSIVSMEVQIGFSSLKRHMASWQLGEIMYWPNGRHTRSVSQNGSNRKRRTRHLLMQQSSLTTSKKPM